MLAFRTVWLPQPGVCQNELILVSNRAMQGNIEKNHRIFGQVRYKVLFFTLTIIFQIFQRKDNDSPVRLSQVYISTLEMPVVPFLLHS